VRPSVVLLLPAILLASAVALAQAPPAPSPTPAPTATPTVPAKPAANAEVTFKNGFTLRTPDGKNELRVGGAVHFDSRAYFGDSVAPDSFDIRRARLDVNAKLHGFMEFRIQAALEDSPYIRNAWLDLRVSDPLHLRVGQMKVPFSTEWMTLDNDVNLLERSSDTPVYPFFDRGFLLWGDLADKRLTYQVGAYTGAGVDVDAPKGDVDDFKDVTLRLFALPFKSSSHRWLQGLNLVVEGTRGAQTIASRRFDTRGLTAADYESQVWRWRGDQMIATDGRSTDQIASELDTRTRWGAEVNYVNGPFTASLEWLRVDYDNISVYHDFWVGSSRVRHDGVTGASGGVRHVSGWCSYFLTGEKKILDAFGWRTPDPKREFEPGAGGGAWEVLGRVSNTTTDDALFDTVRVNGFTADELQYPGAQPVGEGSFVKASVLQGAPDLWEATLEVNWTASRNLRLQLAVTDLWAPDFALASTGTASGGIISGGNSELSDRTLIGTQVERELAAMLRFIFRI
jgi:phosphate-selective porin